MLLFCNGKNGFCYKETCDKSCEYHDGSGSKYVKEQTFGDKIRSMTDEELTDFFFTNFCGIDSAFFFCTNKKECGDLLDADQEIPDEWCKKCLLNRLRQPAEIKKYPTMPVEDKRESGLVEED